MAALLARAKEEFADSEDETDDLSAETDEITDGAVSAELGVNQVEK